MSAPAPAPAILTTRIPKSLKQDTTLFINAKLSDVADIIINAYDDPKDHLEDIFANLIYNYMGKIFYNDQHQKAQVNLTTLEKVVQKRLGKTIKCPVYADDVLAWKCADIVKSENGFVRAFRFDLQDDNPEKNLDFNLKQLADTVNYRKENQFSDGHIIKGNNTTIWKYDYRSNTRKLKADGKESCDNFFNNREAAKRGAIHTKKLSGTLIPTIPGYINIFKGMDCIFLYDFRECYDDNAKFSFKGNAVTNINAHYSNGRFFYPDNSNYYATIDKVRQHNKWAVGNQEIISHNEIKAGLPRKGVRGVIASQLIGNYNDSVNRTRRIKILYTMYRAKDELKLDYDLPVFLRREKQDLNDYIHEDRLLDVLTVLDQTNSKCSRLLEKNNYQLFKNIVKCSYHRATPETQSKIKAKLKEVCANEAENLISKENKRSTYVSKINIRQFDHETISTYIECRTAAEKALIILAIVTIIPLIVIGTLEMLERNFDKPEDTDIIEGGFKVLGIGLGTVTIIPALCFGLLRSINTFTETQAVSSTTHVSECKVPSC